MNPIIKAVRVIADRYLLCDRDGLAKGGAERREAAAALRDMRRRAGRFRRAVHWRAERFRAQADARTQADAYRPRYYRTRPDGEPLILNGKPAIDWLAITATCDCGEPMARLGKSRKVVCLHCDGKIVSVGKHHGQFPKSWPTIEQRPMAEVAKALRAAFN